MLSGMFGALREYFLNKVVKKVSGLEKHLWLRALVLAKDKIPVPSPCKGRFKPASPALTTPGLHSNLYTSGI